ncbi:MAG TPA: hypothetical protein VLJ84_12465 [Usitatibacter sp.]|nr:hypothetical protein [Usitatibacter sp.]
MARSERIFYLLCGSLLIAGTVLFIGGGSQHPPTDARLGPVGSDEFFRNFVRHVLAHPNWELIHAGILAGPLCWALGSVGAALRLRELGESRFGVLGVTALAMGAAAWAVTFVFDGFVALRIAQAIGAASPGEAPALYAAFHANQVVVIRLGLVSLMLIGAGMAAFGVSILCIDVPRHATQWVLGSTGIALGLWPSAACALGIFRPGPFTSPAWTATALLTGAWFLLLGLRLIVTGARGAAHRNHAVGPVT